ncbi:MAG: flagellar protein FlaI [Natronomonas sp.]|jgi:flagellar protein FlaI
MAINDADGSESGQMEGMEKSEPSPENRRGGPVEGSDVRIGEYSWADFMEEHGHEAEVSRLYEKTSGRPPSESGDSLGLESSEDLTSSVPYGDDWESVDFEPDEYLGFHPDDVFHRIRDTAAPRAKALQRTVARYIDPETTPVTKGRWMWEHFKQEYYYDDDGERPRRDDGSVIPFRPEEYLGFDPDRTEGRLSRAEDIATELHDLVDERTVNVAEDLDEDEFFSTADGQTTVANRYDLEKAVPQEKKPYFREEDRYWVNKPYAFVVLFHSEKENEKKYYAIEPHLNEIEGELKEFLTGKLRNAIKYSDDTIPSQGQGADRPSVIERETRRLLERYDLFEKTANDSSNGMLGQVKALMGGESPEETDDSGGLDGIEVRPEPVVLEENSEILSEYQVEKLLYHLKRDFVGYERIDPIKHDINVEDISCDGWNSPVFVYHTDYEQIISNIYHGEEELNDFVVKLAQRSGKGISKRRPQVDATLPDGSRAQLTLGREVSDHGTNYTIRQFKDVPFTPIDLINWNTFSLDEMAFLWLCIENNKSLIFAGGTASGKTTSLNAVSLFIPSNTKIVSIEDTREVELPQRNWVASVTRPSFSDDDEGDVDEFDLLEAALRQRPDYIVMGEVRGEEGRDLFQVMSTGHTSYSTFHADTVGEVLKRFTTDPINVSKTMFTALDLVSIQTQTRVDGHKVRRNKTLTEVNHYDAENDEINVQDVYQWQAETDEFLKMSESNTLEEIKFDRGWNQERLEEELFKRRTILAYLIENGLSEYTKVAATIQAFINNPETVLTLIANGTLQDALEDLREMESVLIDVDPEKEALVPRPEPGDETYNTATDILERAEDRLFDEYRGTVPSGLGSALAEGETAAETEQTPPEPPATDESRSEFDFGDQTGDGTDDMETVDFGTSGETNLGGGTAVTGEDEVATSGPDWLSDDGGFDFGDTDLMEESSADSASETTSPETDADGAAGRTETDAGASAGPDDGSTPPPDDAGTEPESRSEKGERDETDEEPIFEAPDVSGGSTVDGGPLFGSGTETEPDTDGEPDDDTDEPFGETDADEGGPFESATATDEGGGIFSDVSDENDEFEGGSIFSDDDPFEDAEDSDDGDDT